MEQVSIIFFYLNNIFLSSAKSFFVLTTKRDICPGPSQSIAGVAAVVGKVLLDHLSQYEGVPGSPGLHVAALIGVQPHRITIPDDLWLWVGVDQAGKLCGVTQTAVNH